MCREGFERRNEKQLPNSRLSGDVLATAKLTGKFHATGVGVSEDDDFVHRLAAEVVPPMVGMVVCPNALAHIRVMDHIV